MGIIVPGEGTLEPLAQRRIEPLEGEASRDVFGLAAARRDHARGKHGGERRYALERAVGVPELVGLIAQRQPVIGRHNLAALVDRAEDHEVGASAERTDLGDLEQPEPARESKLALVCHLLAAKDDDGVLLEYRTHLVVRAVIGWDVREPHAAQLGGQPGTQRNKLHRRALRCLDCSTFHQIAPARKEGRWREERSAVWKADGSCPSVTTIAAAVGAFRPVSTDINRAFRPATPRYLRPHRCLPAR